MKANRCLHSDRIDKEGDILDRDSSPNESPDRVKEGERGRMIGQNPKAEVDICILMLSADNIADT